MVGTEAQWRVLVKRQPVRGWGREPGRNSGICKGPEAGMNLACVGEKNHDHVSGAEWVQGRGDARGDRDMKNQAVLYRTVLRK